MRIKAMSGAVLVAAAAVFMGMRAFAADPVSPDSGALPTAGLSESSPSGNSPIEQVTKASVDRTLSFVRPGRVVKVLVQLGDHVDAGQLLAQQDDSEEQAEYIYAKEQAADDTRVTAQEKIRIQKKAVYDRKVAAGDSVNTTELEEAKLDWDVAIAQTALAIFEHIQDGRKLDQAAAVLEKTKLISPTAGVVQDVYLQEGENVDVQSMKVVRVVNVNPLWIDVPVPFAQAQKIKVNDSAHVIFSDRSNGEGTVLAIAPVAVAASGTRNVRVSVRNDAMRPAGERVTVTFDPASNVAENK